MVKQMAEASGTDPAGYVAESPGLSAYALSDGAVYRTYVTTARGLELAMGYYFLLDRTPIGRDEGGPQPFWLRRHDEYEDAGSGATSRHPTTRTLSLPRVDAGSAPPAYRDRVVRLAELGLLRDDELAALAERANCTPAERYGSGGRDRPDRRAVDLHEALKAARQA